MGMKLSKVKPIRRTNEEQVNTDGSKVKRWMEIDKTLFDAFNEFELDDLSFFNEVDRHYEKSEVTEATLNRRAAAHPGAAAIVAHGNRNVLDEWV